jgi:regulatory protein
MTSSPPANSFGEDNSSGSEEWPVTPRPLAWIGADPENDASSENDLEVVDRAVVEQRVLRALSRKAMSESEVRSLIEENGLDGDDAEGIVERLIELRYVDDRTLAEELKRKLSETKGQSKGTVSRAMSTRGIPADIVADVVAEIDDDDERVAARELAEKRARQMSSLDAQTLERRLSGFLARRGYPGGLVREIVSDIVRARRAPSGPRFR